MDYCEIGTLADDLRGALEMELAALEAVAVARMSIEERGVEVERVAREAGLIDGSNKDTREAQRAAALAQDTKLIGLQTELARIEHEAAQAQIARQHQETRVSLTRAWLYSRSGVQPS